MTFLSLHRRSAVALAVAGMAWVAAVGGRWWGMKTLAALAVVGLMLAAVTRQRVLVLVMVVVASAACWSGYASAERERVILGFPTEEGGVELTVRLLQDARAGQHGWWARAVADPPEAGRPRSVPMLLSFETRPPAVAGEDLSVSGRRSSRSGTAGGDPYSGVVTVEEMAAGSSELPVWWEAGNLVRERSLRALRGRGPARALLAGFLVGDTSEVPAADMEAMRRSGLTHLVAVSGSNVSLFLALAMVAAGPLAAGPRRRAVLGLVALVVLVVATRWEPSVIRASVMAALVLGGRVGGWALDTGTALAVTIVAVVVVSGELATDVGFTMSVLATLGVLVGARLTIPSVPQSVSMLVGATAGAQLAVAPVLLAVFGTLPLLAPLTNLVAIPVVSFSSAVGAVGVATGWEPLISLAALGAEVVLLVARIGGAWPQIGWTGFTFAVVLVIAAARKNLRPAVAVVAAAAVAVGVVAGPVDLVRPSAVVLDVGQGDAILVLSEDGATMLVDGGPDPALLDGKLVDYGVARLDLVVLTHVHADHAGGLEAVIGRRPVGEIWLPELPHSTPASRRVEELVSQHSVPARSAPLGETVQLGELQVEVLGPRRRYASPNDQSAVLRVGATGGPRLLLTGDIETHAQADLAGVEAEVLKVPHQGGATSDPDWLSSVGAAHAVISVGPNQFGHPSPEVERILRQAGATVWRTDLHGDVVIPLARIDGGAVAIETAGNVQR